MSSSSTEPVVVTGIGLVTANGFGREAVWQSVRRGESGIRIVAADDEGLPNFLDFAAPVDMKLEFPGQLKSLRLARHAAEEAIFDANIDFESMDLDRFGCAISGQMGDLTYLQDRINQVKTASRLRFEQWLPSGPCWNIATRYGLNGPRFSHSTACASGLIDTLCAARAIRDGRCDIALAGSAECIHPLMAAGFKNMRVLAAGDDPAESCLPFDIRRRGFVMGEGAGMLVIERLNHALARGAKIYAEVVNGKMLADAHHVTSLNSDSEAIVRLIDDSLRQADLTPADVAYVNAHGTGTEQNDLLESKGIREAFGVAADDICVSSMKSMLGHLVNASGTVELAITILAMRDGFAPPTLNLREPDPRCDLEFLPMVGRNSRFQHAIKLSLAFGGHLVAALVRRWNNSDSGFAYPDEQPIRRVG